MKRLLWFVPLIALSMVGVLSTPAIGGVPGYEKPASAVERDVNEASGFALFREEIRAGLQRIQSVVETCVRSAVAVAKALVTAIHTVLVALAKLLFHFVTTVIVAVAQWLLTVFLGG